MSSRVYTGRNNKMLADLVQDLRTATEIRIIVSFIMESGVKILRNALLEAREKGADIRILTGTYLGVTEPSALYLLKEILGDEKKIHIFNGSVSFHPKGYYIAKDKKRKIYIGSSNMSGMGLVHGIEWNYVVEEHVDSVSINQFEDAFQHLFDRESVPASDEFMQEYSRTWRRSLPHSKRDSELPKEQRSFEPTGIQIEALYELNKARLEGIDKGLVVAATGSGKTYISAFDVLQYGARRLLFIAHREEILLQALESFKSIFPDKTMAIFNGNNKENQVDFLFASVQTLAKKAYLQESMFTPNDFDYIVVDEFHHAAAQGYRRILDYFKPKFLLGLTATPYRMDNQDILSLCDNHIIYDLNLMSAINRGIVCPFRYYAVYDVVDYSGVTISGGKYDVDELEKIYQIHTRNQEIYRKYSDFAGQRTLGFCVSIGHAENMAKFFRENGVSAEAIHSKTNGNRSEAIQKLVRGELRVLFVVDIFNEGVDIPEVDTVMFLRPTESYVVYLQQLGRGLRKHKGKDKLTVIDFIGNYKRAHYKPLLLAGKNPMYTKQFSVIPDRLVYPQDCQVQFDLRLIDLFKELRKKDPIAQQMADEFERLRALNGERPTRQQLFLGSDIDHREFLRQGYLDFIAQQKDISAEESSWKDTIIEDFLRRMEKTAMSKSYKLPILELLLNGKGFVSYEKLGEGMKKFYTEKELRQRDLERDKSNQGWQTWDSEDFLRLALKMPVHFLTKSEREFIWKNDDLQSIGFSQEIIDVWSPALEEHLRDILSLRELEYFSRDGLKRGVEYDRQ